MSFLIKHYREFLAYLRDIRGVSDATVETYRTVLEDAVQLIDFNEETDPPQIDLMPYRMKISDQKPKTIAKKVSAVRSYLSYLKEIGYHFRVLSDEQIKVPKKLPKPVPEHFISEVLERSDPQVRLMVLIFYGMGLRISELANLEKGDITHEWIRIVGKGSKSRILPVLPMIREGYEAYLRHYAPKRHLFESEGKKLSENQIRYRVKKIFKEQGLNMTPHQLRHSFATALLSQGARITDVSELLGHSALSTTEIYTQVSNSLKMKNYRNAHPLCKDDDETD